MLSVLIARTISLPQYVLAGEVAAYIHAHAFDQPDLLQFSALTRHFGVCSTSLKTAFKARHGISVHAFIMKIRHEKICELICDSHQSLKVISSIAGYTDISNFSRDFTKMAGVSPTIYREQQKLKFHNPISMTSLVKESS